VAGLRANLGYFYVSANGRFDLTTSEHGAGTKEAVEVGLEKNTARAWGAALTVGAEF
jgi:hypothetical protein